MKPKMRYGMRVLLIVFSMFAIILGVISRRASNQNASVRELFEQNGIAIQFSDGQFCGSISQAGKRNHFFSSVDTVYLDLPRDEPKPELYSILRKLPRLNRIIIRYAGNDFAAYNRHQQKIENQSNELKQKISKALPYIEIIQSYVTVDYGSNK